MNKKWLRKIVLVTLYLVVNIMVSCVVTKKYMEGVPRKHEPTVIIDPFDRGKYKENDRGPRCHP